MSVQEKNKKGQSAQKPQGVESVTTPKKRKHDTTDRESSKKKKKQRRDDPATPSIAASQEPSQSQEKEKRKKKKKSKDQEEAAAPLREEMPDLELDDAPAAQTAQEVEGAQHLDYVADDMEGAGLEEEDALKLLETEDPTSFYSTRLSLCISVPAISLESGTSSLLATHLAPLLLTYFPPAQGIVLAFSDPVLSAKPNPGINLPLLPPRLGELETDAEVLAAAADDYGVCWVWLTVTFLVLRPERGDELHGWTNVTSEGFVGLVSYNYFQTAVGKTRIPSDWRWSGPTKGQAQRVRKKGKKGRLRSEDGTEGTQENDTQETDVTLVEASSSEFLLGDDGGYFADADGAKIPSTLTFRVVDTEIVPAHDRHKWTLQIDGTLLDDDAEKEVVEEERAKFQRAQERSRSKSPGGSELLMSGAVGRSMSREGSVASRIPGQPPARQRMTY